MSNFNTFKIGPLLVILVTMMLACMGGAGIVNGDYVPVAFTMVFLMLVAVIQYGERLYILIPTCWGLTGSIYLLPLPFTVRDLVILTLLAIFIQHLIFKTEKSVKARWEGIDVILWINLAYLATVFLRNPVGFNAIGGGLVGGKPYVEVLLGIVTYLILIRHTITPSQARKLPLYVICAAIFSTVAGGIGFFFPELGDRLAYLYTGFSSTGMIGLFNQEDVSLVERLGFLQQIGGPISLYAVSVCNPASLLSVGFLRYGILFAVGIIAVLASGFRSGLGAVFLNTTISLFLRERFLGLAKILIALIAFTTLAIALSFFVRLPGSFQRALSFLPGNWEQNASLDASASSDWRFEMWQMMLTSDKYIHNKLLGDGFGYRREDLERGVDVAFGRQEATEIEAQQEMFMLDGDVHSGPVSAIRFVGYVGLILLLILMFFYVRYAVGTIRMASGTEYSVCAYFFFIPVLAFPIEYIFIFGDYRTDLVNITFLIGMMKLIRKSIQLYSKNETSAVFHSPT